MNTHLIIKSILEFLKIRAEIKRSGKLAIATRDPYFNDRLILVAMSTSSFRNICIPRELG